ncbi:hypothetical protein ES703_101656 [subsurface metagenome]
MTKRDEIREGIKHIIMLAEGVGQTTGEYPDLAQLILEYLHSQGVVIEVNGECDNCQGTGKFTFVRTNLIGSFEYDCPKCGGTGESG